MARYRHYQNRGSELQLVYATSTCLDFAHLFRRPEMKSRMVRRLLSDHIYYQSNLFAFVVMANHIHFIHEIPEGRTSPWMMQRLKSNSSKELLPLLTAEEHAQMSAQVGLDGRQFWMRSFDSLVIANGDTFWQKTRYIHQNPVRAGLVEDATDYRWSSHSFFEAGAWDWETGLPLEHLISEFK